MCTAGRQEADLGGELLAHALDPREQVSALVAVDQRNQAVAHFEAECVDRRDVVPARLGTLGLWLGDAPPASSFARRSRSRQPPGEVASQPGQRHEHHVRHARHDAEQREHSGRQPERAWHREQLLGRAARRHRRRCPRATRSGRLPPRSPAPESAPPARRRSPAARSCARPARRSGRAGSSRSPSPPITLMNRIRMPAIASPRTNFEAPSIDP